MRVAVAGAGGFIGSHVVEKLRAAGHEVLAIDRPQADLQVARSCGAEAVAADVAVEGALTSLLRGCERAVNATGLFDLGAPMVALRAGNVDAADRFVRAAKEAGLERVVHLSSVAVYGPVRVTPMPEDGPQRPRSAYDVTKQEGEAAVLAHNGQGIEVAVLRPTLVYGPRSRYGHALFISLTAMGRALGWEALPLPLGGPTGHHVHVEDVARAAELLLTAPGAAGQAFNIADDTPIALGDALASIAEAVGLRVRPVRGASVLWPVALRALPWVPGMAIDRLNRWFDDGYEALRRRGWTPVLKGRFDRDWLGYFTGRFIFDTRRIKALGFAPAHPDFRLAVGEVVRWYRDAGWLPPPREKRKRARA